MTSGINNAQVNNVNTVPQKSSLLKDTVSGLGVNAVMTGVITAYSAQHPVAKIVLDDLSEKSIGRFLELKHFETLYTGYILRALKGNFTPEGTAFDEVLQPNVEIYKKEVKKALAE